MNLGSGPGIVEFCKLRIPNSQFGLADTDGHVQLIFGVDDELINEPDDVLWNLRAEGLEK